MIIPLKSLYLYTITYHIYHYNCYYKYNTVVEISLCFSAVIKIALSEIQSTCVLMKLNDVTMEVLPRRAHKAAPNLSSQSHWHPSSSLYNNSLSEQLAHSVLPFYSG